MTYRYTTRDLLQEPELYHFTPFEGSGLLTSYVASRRAAIGSFAARAVPDLASCLPTPSGIEMPGNGEVRTTGQLQALAALRLAGREDLVVDAWAAGLLRKFEVFKRLRAAYGPGLRYTDPAPAQTDDYALLALVLATGRSLDADLKALSGLLKLNDAVCSASASVTPVGAAAAVVAVELELVAVEALAGRHGVELGPR